MDRPCRRGRRRAGDLPRALPARLPGRGPLPEAALPRRQPAGGRGAGREASPASPSWSASPSRSPEAATPATPTTRLPSSPTAPCAASTARTASPTTPSSTSSATSSPATEPMTVDVGGTRVGLTICEDCWVTGPPARREAEQGAQLIANPSGSPYHRGKGREREAMFAERARAYGTYFAFCNLVGGQDELVFDGQSLVIGPDGELLARAAQFEQELLVCDIPAPEAGAPRRAALRPRRGLRRPDPWSPRLRRQERLRTRRDRPLGRDRLRPGGDARGRRRRP